MPRLSEDKLAAERAASECLEGDVLTDDATDGMGEGGSGLYS
jgi:hypothetical protein